MQHSFKNPPKTSLQDHPNFRVVQVSHRSGNVGMLLPHANLVVPDKQAVKRLGDIIQLYEKLPTHRFEYGFTSDYDRSSETPVPSIEPVDFNSTKDLPLFDKL